jgi:error-prone DNA polymerase
VTRGKFPLVEGLLQNQDNVIHVMAVHLIELSSNAMELKSHDFY